MPFKIDDALRYLVEHEGSDLHLKVGAPPIVRVHGELGPIEGSDPLAPEDSEAALAAILTDPKRR
jgi:twitching motility protein PilT